MIEVFQLTKKYGDRTVVKEVSFRANPGEVTGFLGPNGAGKTTIMRMLSGFAPPTSGRALVAGYDVFDESMEVRKRIGYLPENVPLYQDMTALDYLTHIAEIRRLDHRRERALRLLDDLGLRQRANSRIRAFSKGMRQRVGLASVLMHDPQVLILDEPTIGLDPIQVLELRDLIRELGRDHTVLFSTHILSEAEQLCDQVVILNQGEVIAQGKPAALRAELGRGGRILIRVESDMRGALAAIRRLAHVAQAQIERDAIIVTPADMDHDPRGEISRAVLNGGWHLTELRPLAVNLEEIFLEVTRRRDAGEVFQAPVAS